MSETTRQPVGQWCWCDDPPEGQPPHNCAEDHATRDACQYDGAHVHPRSPWSDIRDLAERARKTQEAINELGAGPPSSRSFTDADRQLIGRAREIGPELRASASDR